MEGAAVAAAPRPRPLITREIIARQFERLADWHIQTHDPDRAVAGGPAPLKAGHLLAGRSMAAVFDALCDVHDHLDDIDRGVYEYAACDDPDDIERDVREAREDALIPLVEAALRALAGVDECSICGATYIGGHCPNCGWFTHPNNTRREA